MANDCRRFDYRRRFNPFHADYRIVGQRRKVSSLGLQVSKPSLYTARMNRHLRRYAQSAEETEVIAVFGEARLVRQINRRLEIRGGTGAERAQARNWAARFLRSAGGGQWDASG